MAKDDNKGGFFARFRKDVTPTPPVVQSQARSIPSAPESGSSQLNPVQPKASVVPKPAAPPASSESPVDTVEAINRYCSSLVDIGTSQLKVAEMILGMLSHSINKIVDGSKNKK
jgi:hypothetical protein